MRAARPAISLLAALLLVVGAASCGGDDGEEAKGGGGEKVVKVKVGTLPIASAAALYVGREKGFFKDEGLEIEPQPQQGGAEVAAGVQSGSFDFGYAGVIPIVIAKAKRLPVQIVATTDDQLKDPSDADVITVARKDTDIRSAKDLEGATVGVNVLGGVAEVVIKGSIEKAGGDPSKVKLVEVPFPEMVAALDSKRIDAAFVAEPFRLQAVQGGAHVLKDASYQAVDPKGFELGIYFATDEYIGENSDVVDRFVRASNRAADYSAKHPAEVRKAITTYTEIPPDIVKKIKLPRWDAELREESVQLQAELTKKYGIIEEVPDIDQLIR
jgi:NitT/TauT family transport system substrate-binding protein